MCRGQSGAWGGLQGAPADQPHVCLSGLLLSSVIVGNTHGQLAEIDLRQGEETREPCGGRGGRGGEEGQDSPLTRGGRAAEPSFRCQNQVQSWFCQKLCDLGQITLSIPCALVSSLKNGDVNGNCHVSIMLNED